MALTHHSQHPSIHQSPLNASPFRDDGCAVPVGVWDREQGAKTVCAELIFPNVCGAHVSKGPHESECRHRRTRSSKSAEPSSRYHTVFCLSGLWGYR